MYFKTALLLLISISFVLADDSNIKEIKVDLFKPCQPSEKDFSHVEKITHSTGKISKEGKLICYCWLILKSGLSPIAKYYNHYNQKQTY